MSKVKAVMILIAMMFVGLVGPVIPAVGEEQSPDPNKATEDGMDTTIGMALNDFRSIEGGDALANVFAILFGQMFDSVKEATPDAKGTYVFHAVQENTTTTPLKDLMDVQSGSWAEMIFLPEYQDEFEEIMGDDSVIPYAIVNRTIGDDLNVTYTIGVSVTCIIYDADNSLIEGVQRLIHAFERVQEIQVEAEAGRITQEQAGAQTVEVLAPALLYFLIHINDLITGEELIIVNPVHYETMKINGTYGETHTLYYQNGTAHRNEVNQTVIDQLNALAVANNDEYLEWVLNGGVPEDIHTVGWTTFSFSLLQLWLKTFHLEINMGALADTIQGKQTTEGNATGFAIFQGMDIEFFLITHTMVTPLLYDDVNTNKLIDVVYEDLLYENGSAVTYTDSSDVAKNVSVPISNEVKYRVGLKRLDEANPWMVMAPQIAADGSEVKWGVTLNNAVISWIPIGSNPEEWGWASPDEEVTISEISLGFTFTPGEEEIIRDVDTGDPTGIEGREAKIKLDQTYGSWNYTGAATPTVPPDFTNLDLSVVFFSTVFHFQFNAEATTGTDKVEEMVSKNPLLENGSYSKESGELTFGRNATEMEGGVAHPMLGRVDIAGPNYTQYDANGVAIDTYAAQTQIVPIALFEGRAEGGNAMIDESKPENSYSVNAFASVDVSTMFYAINYYTFSDHPALKIVHDPTFSVYMTFPSKTYWAIIIIFGVVALVGIAALLITKKKNS